MNTFWTHRKRGYVLALWLTLVLIGGLTIARFGIAHQTFVTIGEAYDGDTLYALVPALPEPLNKVKIRIRGIDTPEIRRAKCDEEKVAALAARDFNNKWLANATTKDIANFKWGKYGGRIVADVLIDGRNLAQLLIDNGYAIAYDGGKKTHDWCH